MLRRKMPHVFRRVGRTNFKLGTGMEYADPHHRYARWPQRSKVKITRSCRQSDAFLPIIRQRKFAKIPKNWQESCPCHGWHPHEFRGQKVKGQGHQAAPGAVQVTACMGRRQIKATQLVLITILYLQSWFLYSHCVCVAMFIANKRCLQCVYTLCCRVA